MKLLSVVIPVYNEEENLYKNISGFIKYLDSCKFEYELLIVNDGSTDESSKVINQLVKDFSKVRKYDFSNNQGKGAAIKLGLLAAKGDYRMFLDADNATSIDHVDLAMPLIEKGKDIIIGSRNSRDVEGGEQAKKQVFWKRFFGQTGNLLIRSFVLGGIYDTQCGFKIFNENFIKNIFPHLKTKRWAVDVEILLLAKKFNYEIEIIPVKWYNSEISRVKKIDYFKVLYEIVLIKYRVYKLNKTYEVSSNNTSV